MRIGCENDSKSIRSRLSIRGRHRAIPFWLRTLLVCLSPMLLPVIATGADQSADFRRTVRPILAQHCFACHGPDEKSRKGGFRLDTREGAVGESDSGERPVVPNHPESSELVTRIESNDDSLRMPPEPHDRLTRSEIDALRNWIAQGAPYEPHWAFVPPATPALPQVEQSDWPRNSVDHFILRRLEAAGLRPSIEADRRTLIRRVTLDLTGLPPTPSEVDAFVRDTSDHAYEKVVDRLMKSTAYAERQTQDWLDLARYADTRGFADDKMREIWPWRDWVIRAIDQNMPFDQFTIEQLAGDMLPDASIEQRLATGFHRNAPQAKGQTYPVEEYRLKGVVDRVNTTGRVWLGLTVGCAECHDHKFDPFTQRDYYSLFAVFNNIEHGGSGFAQGGPTMKYRPPSTFNRDSLERQRTAVEAELDHVLSELPPRLLPDGESLSGHWNKPAVESDADNFNLNGDFTITAHIRTQQDVADLVSKYDWRGKQRSYVFGVGGEADTNGVPGHLFCWVSSQTDPFRGAEIHGSFRVNDGRDHEVAIVFEAGKSMHLFVDGVEDEAARLVGNVPGSIARSNRRLSIGSGYKNSLEPDAYRFKGELSDVRVYSADVSGKLARQNGGAEIARLHAKLRSIDSTFRTVSNELAAVPVMRERESPRETFIHNRGNFLDRGEAVGPAIPAMFSVDAKPQSYDRLQFARWLVSGKNPLVARVTVNRFWQLHFGRGFVATSDDFGIQGAVPTHPELLDWLATEFVRSGWDMKRMHRLVVTSATYRQSSNTPASPSSARAKSATVAKEPKQATDPMNELWGRMPRVRLSAEQLRDQALAVSGLLVRTVGGPPVFPKQPAGYWKQRALPGEWKESHSDGRHRRTVYTYWRRMALHPSLELLNAPAREICVAKRETSNVPTQALVLLNDPMFHEAAVSLADRLMNGEQADERTRLVRAFELVLSRVPDKAEEQKFLEFIAAQKHSLASDPEAVEALSGLRSGPASTEQAAWTLTCTVLLNLDETITRP